MRCRVLIIVAALLWSTGAASPASAKPTTPNFARSMFQVRVRDLHEAKWICRDSIFAGPTTVLVLTDIHHPPITAATLAGIDTLSTIYPFDVLGIESFDHGFRNEYLKHRGPVADVVDSVYAGTTGESALLAQRDSLSPTTSYALISAYHDAHPERVVGLEANDSTLTVLNTWVVFQGLSQSFFSAWRSGRSSLVRGLTATSPLVRGMLAGERYLAERDSLFPLMPPDLLAHTDLPGRLLRASPWPAVAAEYHDKLAAWFDLRIIGDRNVAIASALRDEMTRRQSKYAIMLVGRLHSTDTPTRTSVQRRLAELGVSTIVIDPPAVARMWESRRQPEPGEYDPYGP